MAILKGSNICYHTFSCKSPANIYSNILTHIKVVTCIFSGGSMCSFLCDGSIGTNRQWQSNRQTRQYCQWNSLAGH